MVFNLIDDTFQGRIQDFLEGMPTPKRGSPIYYSAKFLQKLHENEKNGPRGWASIVLLCRFTTVFYETPCTYVVYDVDGGGWRNPLSGVHGGVNENGRLPPANVLTHLNVQINAHKRNDQWQ